MDRVFDFPEITGSENIQNERKSVLKRQQRGSDFSPGFEISV
jgi:hypothetical protein